MKPISLGLHAIVNAVLYMVVGTSLELLSGPAQLAAVLAAVMAIDLFSYFTACSRRTTY
jgi:hypothetical protein